MSYQITFDLPKCQKWVAENYDVVGTDLTMCIGLEKDGNMVCVTGYNHFNGKSCHGHYYHKGGYVPPSYIWYVHYYPFVQNSLDILIGIVSSANKAIIKLMLRLGYIFNGLIKGACPEGDLMIYTLNKKDCRFLGGSYAKR
jgi:hypothetical protein